MFVMLCRLVDGRLRRDPRHITPDMELNCFDLSDLIQLRAPKDVVLGYAEVASPPGGVEGIIQRLAQNLRRYGREILVGDFSVFPELDRAVKARASQLW